MSAATPASGYGTPVPEQGGTIPAAQRRAPARVAADAPARTPQAALALYAVVWGDWTSATIPAVQTRLAGMSVGSARAQALQAVASYQADPTLQRSSLTSSVSVVAIAPGVGAAAGWWVVTVCERTGGSGQASGLPATFHVNYAKLTRVGTGWVVSTWTPRS